MTIQCVMRLPELREMELVLAQPAMGGRVIARSSEVQVDSVMSNNQPRPEDRRLGDIGGAK